MNDDPWEIRPPNLEDQVDHYVHQARRVAINPDLKKKYARIVIAAVEIVAYRERDEQATRDQVARMAAREHGIYTDDSVKARKDYAAARRAQQQVHASASACSNKLAALEKLLETRYESLQVDIAARFPRSHLAAASKLIMDFASATALSPNVAEVKIAKSELSFTIPGHAFVWWRKHISQYKHRWVDMYALAQCWHLTDIKDLETFQRQVRKFKPAQDLWGGTVILRCPPWALV